MTDRLVGCVILLVGWGCTTDFTYKYAEDSTSDAEATVDAADTTQDEAIADNDACGTHDDCDGDGWTPAEGDCCDFNESVYPGQTEWFTDAYACPEESWDYNCDAVIEYDTGTSGAVLVGGCAALSMTNCSGATGWVDTPPACGAPYRYAQCSWNYSPPRCIEDSVTVGIVGCR